MKNKNISKLEKNNEIMEKEKQKSLDKLFIYRNILQTNKNVFAKIKKSKNHIKLLNNDSFYKISLLSNIPIEKMIKFKNSYELSDTDSDNESKNGLRGMAKLKERLLRGDHNNTNNINSRRIKNKKYFNNNKYHIKKTKEDKNSVILLDEVQSSVKNIFNKEGNSIGANYELYKMTWKNLYKWLLLFPLTILFGLLIFIYKDNYGFSFAEFFCFLIIFLICIVSMNGNEKMLAKKKVNFRYENSILFLISFLCLYILICANTDMIELTAYYFLSRYYYLTHAIFFTLIVFCFVLIYLNKKMVGFYIKYSQILESGVLLTDRS